MDAITDVRVGDTPIEEIPGISVQANAVLVDGPLVLGKRARRELAEREDDGSLPGLTVATFEKVRPFWWAIHFPHSTSDSIAAQRLGKTAVWSPTKPEKQNGYDWHPLTYVEMLSLQDLLGGVHRQHDNDRFFASKSDAARQYLSATHRRRLGNRVRGWFRDRWDEVLNALSPAGN